MNRTHSIFKLARYPEEYQATKALESISFVKLAYTSCTIISTREKTNINFNLRTPKGLPLQKHRNVLRSVLF